MGNPRSFWLERRHLLVFEQFDVLGDVVANRDDEERLISCFVGVKPGEAPQAWS